MRRWMLAGAALAVVSCGGAGGGAAREARDVSGNYALTYDDTLHLKLDVGGAIRERTATGYGGVVDFGTINGQPTTLDLAAFCARPEVRCPSEAFWAKVAITQPHLATSRLDLQELAVINDTQHVLDSGVRAEALGGLVNHADDDRFLLGLGAQGGASGSCAAIALSLAGGRFSRVGEHVETTQEPRTSKGAACVLDGGVDAGATDAGRPTLPDGGLDCALVPVSRLVAPPGAAVDGIKEGKVALGWAGGCAFGPVLVGATLVVETGFTGVRTGAFDPPPYTPAPVVMPDGGLDGGADAGVDGGP